MINSPQHAPLIKSSVYDIKGDDPQLSVAVAIPISAEPHGASEFTTLVLVEIAPAVERALPSSSAPKFKLIAPAANTLPLKIEFVPAAKAPLTCQYTLQAEAPFIKMTLDNVLVDSAPFIWNMNTA